MTFLLNKLEPLQGCFVPNLVEIGHVVLEKKKIKSDGQQTNFDQKSSGELKEKRI